MSSRYSASDFRDQYGDSRYPFVDTATLTSAEGQIIPQGMFRDASLYPIGAVSGNIYISQIQVASRQVTLSFSDGNNGVVASVSFDHIDPPPVLKVVDLMGRPAGTLLSSVSELQAFSTWNFGIHTFSAESTTFVPRVVIPVPHIGVRGVQTESGDVFLGDFLIVGDNGVVVREESPGVLRIDVVGDPLFRRKLCTPVTLFNTPRFVKTINGCGPDKYGNFNLTVGGNRAEKTILRVNPTGDGLKIEGAGTSG